MQILTYDRKVYVVSPVTARNIKLTLIAYDSSGARSEIFLFGAGINVQHQLNYAVALSVWGDTYISIFDQGNFHIGITGLLFMPDIYDTGSLSQIIGLNRLATLTQLDFRLKSSMDPSLNQIMYLAGISIQEGEPTGTPDFYGLINHWNLTYASSRNIPVLLSTIILSIPGSVA